MNRSYRYTTLAIAGLAALALSPLAEARGFGRGGGGPGHGHGGPGRGFGPEMMLELELTVEQQREVKALRQESRAASEPLHTKLQEKRSELQALWQTESPDEEAILAKMTEMDPLRAQLRAQRVKARIAILKILTPEQRALAKELRAERRAKRADKRGKRGKRGKRFDDDFGGFGGPDF